MNRADWMNRRHALFHVGVGLLVLVTCWACLALGLAARATAEGEPPGTPGGTEGGPEQPGAIVVTDLLSQPHTLQEIVAGSPTLLFICDPAVTRCREGAVYFDTQALRITASRIKPACIFLASADAARDAAARMGLNVPVYVDSGRVVPTALLGQEILPAMVLLDSQCRVSRVALGGGESLDSNLTHLLKPGQSHWRLLYVLIPLAIFAIIRFVVE
ncbi:MAG TPA: hypothetical protein VMU02_05330 [bacterium]|nr:hypothetical protein [bacterium]